MFIKLRWKPGESNKLTIEIEEEEKKNVNDSAWYEMGYLEK